MQEQKSTNLGPNYYKSEIIGSLLFFLFSTFLVVSSDCTSWLSFGKEWISRIVFMSLQNESLGLGPTHLYYLFVWMIVFFAFDVSLVSAFLRWAKLDESARWFALHVVGNIFVVWFSAPDAFKVLLWPNQYLAYGPDVSLQCIYAAIALHIYHLVAYFPKLKKEDFIHHFVSAYMAGFFSLCASWGAVRSLHCFFITGLPGGIDYVMLLAVKAGKMNVLTEKKYNSLLNNWVRSVGIVISTAYIHLFIDRNQEHLTYPLLYMLGNLSNIWNAMHYNYIVCESFIKNRTLVTMVEKEKK